METRLRVGGAYGMSPLREGLWQGLSAENECQICQVGVVFRDGQAHRSVGTGQQQETLCSPT